MTSNPELLSALQALDEAVIGEVLSIRIDPQWPHAVATLTSRARGGTRAALDVVGHGGDIELSRRPAGPRRVADEPAIRASSWTAPDDIKLLLRGGALWQQCLDVVDSGILGTTEAAEHRVTNGSEVTTFYTIVGRGESGSRERLDFLSPAGASGFSSQAARFLGRLGGSAISPKKARAARENGRLGGRPRRER